MAVAAFAASAYDTMLCSTWTLFHRQLSGATIFPLCVRMPRIIRRGADCLGEIAGHCVLPFQFFSFFVSFVLDGVDRLSVKHCPNEGLTSQRDILSSSVCHVNFVSLSHEISRPKTLIRTNSTFQFLRESAHLGTPWPGGKDAKSPGCNSTVLPPLEFGSKFLQFSIPTKVWAT